MQVLITEKSFPIRNEFRTFWISPENESLYFNLDLLVVFQPLGSGHANNIELRDPGYYERKFKSDKPVARFELATSSLPRRHTAGLCHTGNSSGNGPATGGLYGASCLEINHNAIVTEADCLTTL